MYRKDFLLKQLDDFFQTIARIQGKIDRNDLPSAETDITSQLSEDAVRTLTDETILPALKDYDYLKFQTELLLLQWKIGRLKHNNDPLLTQTCVTALKKLIALQPAAYDLSLNKALQDLLTT